MFETLRTGGKKDEKIINVQDGISPYRTEKQSKINKSYMYLYSRLKSTYVQILSFWNDTGENISMMANII